MTKLNAMPKVGLRISTLYQECMQFASEKSIIADVGSDHGYLAIMLAKSKLFKKVLATDISKPSLDKTVALAVNQKVDVECRVGDGLDPVPEANVGAICGMGGHEIIKILHSAPTTDKLVLQPVQNHIELREFLIKNKYKIIKDYCIEDKSKFYFIIVTNGKGKNFYTKSQKLFGKNPKNSQDFYKYLTKELFMLKFLQNFDKVTILKNTELKQKYNYMKLIIRQLKKQGN